LWQLTSLCLYGVILTKFMPRSNEAAQFAPVLGLAHAPDAAVDQTLGRYLLLERVGAGGCGVVNVAEQTEPVRRRVALKAIALGRATNPVCNGGTA
jgi:hypothetical protein